jgi:signal peptidase I
MPLWQELPLLLIVAFCLAVLIRTFLFQAFFIPSGSMQNTLEIGDRVLVNKVVYDTRQPARGDIVVFRGTDRWTPEGTTSDQSNQSFLTKLGRTLGDLVGISQPGEKDFIKRVIGLPGDVVQCCDPQGRVMVNGQPLDEPYVSENSPLDGKAGPARCGPRAFDPVHVAPGNMWVMGDHRFVSQDSRCSGQVPIANVIGKAFVIVWPNAHWNTLGTPSTFNDVPKPSSAAPASPVRLELGTPVPGIYVPINDEGLVAGPIAAFLVVPARSRLFRRSRRRRLRA